MSMFDDCPTEVARIISAPAAGGAVTVQWAAVPPVPELWEVLNATIRHDDVVPLTGHWLFEDQATQVQCGDDIVLAVGAREPLYTIEFPRGLALSLAGNRLTFAVPVGATAGAVLTLDVVGRVSRGIR
jgi:hypothetical protein